MTDKCTDKDIGRLLHAYELNLLQGEDRDRFEAHVLECRACFEELKSFAPRGVLLVGSEELKEAFATEAPAVKEDATFWKELWPRKPLVLRPAFLYILLAILIWPSYLGFKMLTGNITQDKITSVQKIRLTDLRSDWGTMFETGKNLDGIIIISCPDIVPGTEYILQIVDERNNTVFSDPTFKDFDMHKNAAVIFPRSLMRPGIFTVTVSRAGVDSATELCRYEFGIK